ncbi:MAG: FAD-binding oxidoreductase, partial [Bryobacteraceae bacterium]
SLALLRTRFPDIPAAARAAILYETEDSELALEPATPLLDQSWMALGPRDRERLRLLRHALPELVNDIVRRNGFLKLGSDYAVPPARNFEMLAEYRRRLDAEFPGRAVVFGHLGDAHLHANILPESEDDFERGRRLLVDLARAAVALGGVVSAEHGLGKRKAHLLALQYSPAHIEAMKQVKRRLDPDWLLGRGTLFPDEA